MAFHPTDIHVGQRLREARIAAGLTQTALAERLGISFQQVQKYETGGNRISASRLWDLCNTLGLEPNHFFVGIGAKQEPVAEVNLSDVKVAQQLRQIQSDEVHRAIGDLIQSVVMVQAGVETARLA